MRPVDLLELSGGRRTPMIHQSEAAECGLACLAMVAGHHGLKTDMPALRQCFSLSLKGISLASLLQIAEQMGFSGRPLRVEIAQLKDVALPAVLHWDLDHFVVLTKMRRGFGRTRFHLHDPANGTRVVTEEEFSRRFTGVALELLKGERFQPRVERSQLRIGQLWSRMSGLWGALRQVLLLSVVLQLVALAMPFYLQLSVDTVLPGSDMDLLRMLALGFGGLMLVNMLTGWLRAYILVSLGSSLSYQVIVNLYRHLLHLPLPWFQKRHVGDILSRFGSTRPLADLLSQGLIAAILDGVMAFVTLGLMFVYSPLLAAIALVAWCLFAGLKLGFIQGLRLRNVDAITTAAKENSSFIESVRGIAAIKSFGQEGNRQRIWQHLKADAINAQIKLGRLAAGFDAGGQFLIAAERVIFVYVAIGMAMTGEFTVGMIFAFQAYKQQFLDSSTRLVEQAINFRLLDVHLNRIADIALSRPESSAEGPVETVPLSGSLELRSVSFRYGVGEPEILRGVSLKIDQGELVELMGPSGGGKTTLTRLMMGLFTPSSGQVLVDGRPLLTLDASSWRRQIGCVAQDDSLYAGSLAENIAFFDPAIDMARVMEVAGIAGVHDEIQAMPMQYNTLVGDMGSALSGGQKQRVLLARALYPRPKIIFVDEGTAHLDPQCERHILKCLCDLKITRILVTHRPLPAEMEGRVILVGAGQAREFSRPTLLTESKCSA